MRNTSALASHCSSETAYDPFGEPVAGGVSRECVTAAGDRTARRVGAAVFWSLALAILAGRIYAAEIPVTQTVAAYASHIIALR